MYSYFLYNNFSWFPWGRHLDVSKLDTHSNSNHGDEGAWLSGGGHVSPTRHPEKRSQEAAVSSPILPPPPPPPPSGESIWQTGQHSPSGMYVFSQLFSWSQLISSQRTWPLSQTQIWHGSGFQMSLLVYVCPSAVQPASSPGDTHTHGGDTL